MDSTTTMQDLKDAVRDMCLHRGWGGERAIQDPQHMAMAMVIEQGELMEQFAWLDADGVQALLDGRLPNRRAHIAEELADVLVYAVQIALALDIDLTDAMLRKIEVVKRRRDDPDYGRSHPHLYSDEED